MVSSVKLKLVGLDPKTFKKERCGCIRMKINMLGWLRLTFDPDLLCVKHQKEYYMEFRRSKHHHNIEKQTFRKKKTTWKKG